MIILFLIIYALVFGDFQMKCHWYTYFLTNLFLLSLITGCLSGSICCVSLFLPGDLVKVINRPATLPAQFLLKWCLNVLSILKYKKIFTVFIIHAVTTRIYFYLISVSFFPITLLESKSLYFSKGNNMSFEDKGAQSPLSLCRQYFHDLWVLQSGDTKSSL